MLLAAEYGSVTNDTLVLLIGMLAVLAQVFIVVVGVLALVSRYSPKVCALFDDFALRMSSLAIPLAFIVASVATAGSLFFSLGIGWTPCNMCWYQRTMIYPLAVILGVATFLRRASVVPYAIALSLVCIPISIYHYGLEWAWWSESATCDPANPCSQVFLRMFGYLSIPLMALTCALAVITLMLIKIHSSRLQSTDLETN